jgi:hypothetical protein
MMTEITLTFFTDLLAVIVPIVSFLSILSLLLFIPLGLYPRTRYISLNFFLAFKWVIGSTVWLWSAFILLQKGGILFLIMGLFFAVVGVIPLAFLSSLFTLDIIEMIRFSVMFLLYAFTIVYIAYLIGKMSQDKGARQRTGPRARASNRNFRQQTSQEKSSNSSERPSVVIDPSDDFFDNLPEAEQHDPEKD